MSNVAQRMADSAVRLTRYFGSEGVLRQEPGNEAYDSTTGIKSSATAANDYTCTIRLAEYTIKPQLRDEVTLSELYARVVDLASGIFPKKGDVLYDGSDVTVAKSYNVIEASPRRLGTLILYWTLKLEL